MGQLEIRLSRSCVAGLSRRSFPCGCTPYPSLRESVRRYSTAVRAAGPGTEYFGATVSRTQAASIRQRRRFPPVHWASQAGDCAARASSSERRADASVSPLVVHFLCYIFLLGKTESGSAGEQPDKGSPSQGRVKDARLPSLRDYGGLFAFSPLNVLVIPRKTHSDPAGGRRICPRLPSCNFRQIDTVPRV